MFERRCDLFKDPIRSPKPQSLLTKQRSPPHLHQAPAHLAKRAWVPRCACWHFQPPSPS